MKREEKNLKSVQHILESALREFSSMGYGSSSINTICNSGGISKGNLYHYFKDKDAVYLACMQECFEALVAALGVYAKTSNGSARDLLEGYFDARFAFFQKNPSYQRLFREALTAPPRHLKAEISEIRSDFDRLNLELMGRILDGLPLRPDIQREEALRFFRQYQDFVNTGDTEEQEESADPAAYENRRRRALDILLFGIAARGEREHEKQ